jgi:hypothetical protein
MGIYKNGNAVIVTDEKNNTYEFLDDKYHFMKTVHCYLAEKVTEPNDVTYFKENTYIGSMVLNRKPRMLDRWNIMNAAKNGSLYYIDDENGDPISYTEIVIRKSLDTVSGLLQVIDECRMENIEFPFRYKKIHALVIPEDVKISFFTEYHEKNHVRFNIGNMPQELFEEEGSYSEITNKESAETDVWHQIMIEDAELGNG